MYQSDFSEFILNNKLGASRFFCCDQIFMTKDNFWLRFMLYQIKLFANLKETF